MFHRNQPCNLLEVFLIRYELFACLARVKEFTSKMEPPVTELGSVYSGEGEDGKRRRHTA